MNQLFSMTIRDAGGTDGKPESGTFSLYGTELLADGSNYVAELAKAQALEDAVSAVHIGLLSKTVKCGNETKLSAPSTHASNQLARRELKWMISGYDSATFLPVRNEIPCADISLCANESDYMDETSTEYTNLKSAYEAFRVSNAGNSVVVESVTLVGRNL